MLQRCNKMYSEISLGSSDTEEKIPQIEEDTTILVYKSTMSHVASNSCHLILGIYLYYYLAVECSQCKEQWYKFFFLLRKKKPYYCGFSFRRIKDL